MEATVAPIAGMQETGWVRILGDSDLLDQTARFSTNHGTLWIHPVSVRTVDPSRTVAMWALMTTPSSFGSSDDPGSGPA
jgi:hypothetical protein